MTPKYWRRSRTVIFNAMVAVLAALLDVMGLLQPFVTPRTFAVSMVVVTLVNVALRSVTRQPLTRNRET